MPRVPPRGGRRRGISQYGEEVEKAAEEPDQAAATALENSNIDVFYPEFVSISNCAGPVSHLAQKSIEGFIAQPAFMPKDNIIPVTLR